MRDPEQGEREATVDGVTYRPRRHRRCCGPAPGPQRAGPPGHGPHATIERIYVDYDGRVQLGVTVDGVPGQDIMRDIRRYLFFRPDEVEVPMSHDFEKQILVAGVGNAWMQDDGFGSEAARRLEGRELPPGVTVMDFGSGGLDLAYEIMRGYHALVLVDVTPPGRRAGHAVRDRARPGRLRAPDRGRRDDLPARHGPADRAAVRQRGRRLLRQGRRGRVRAGRRSRTSRVGPQPRGRAGGRERARRS